MVIYALIVCASLIGLDQLIKFLVVEYIKDNGVFIFIDGILNFTYVENTGAAFSILTGSRWLLIVITSILLIGLLAAVVTKRIKTPFMVWSAILIIAGGIGNLIDRILHGYVIDYIDAAFLKNFAIFNFADCLVVVGVAMMIIYILIYEPIKLYKKEKEEVKEKNTNEISNNVS